MIYIYKYILFKYSWRKNGYLGAWHASPSIGKLLVKEHSNTMVNDKYTSDDTRERVQKAQ